MASPRVAEFMALFDALSVEEQSIVRDLVELAWQRVSRTLLAERIGASVPFQISAGTRK
jgi:hypothetical protein